MQFQPGSSSRRIIFALMIAAATRAHATQFAYMATNGNSGQGGNVLTMVDLGAHSVKDTVDFVDFGHPRGATVNADGTTVYVTTQVGASVCVLDALTNVVTKRIYFTAFNDFPEDLVLSPDGSKLYVSTGYSKISVIDTATQDIADTIIDSANDYTDRVAINPSGTRLYVTHAAGDISVIDTASHSEVGLLPASASDVRVHPNGSLLYAATGNSVSVIDAATLSAVRSIPVSCSLGALALNPAGTRLYGTCANGFSAGKLVVIDTSSNTEITHIAVGIDPVGVRVTPDGAAAYVVNQLTQIGAVTDLHGAASVIDTATNSVVATIPLGLQVEGKGDFIGPSFRCGNAIQEPGEGCDDGNTIDDSTCPADCQVVHDAIVMTRPPLNVTIPTGKFVVSRRLRVKVRNGDVAGTANQPIALDADSDCAPGSAVVWPADFGGGDSSVVLGPGKMKTAKVTVQIFGGSGTGFSTFNRKAPRRCNITLTARTLPRLGVVDVNPSNNVSKLELNVIDRDDVEQSTLHETVLQSLKPKMITLPAAQASLSKQVYPKLSNADYLPVAEDAAAHSATVTQTAGDCPPGVIGGIDFALRQPGDQVAALVGGGSTRTATVVVNASRAAFPLATAISPQRCTATFSAVGPSNPDPDPSNNSTTLTIDVLAK